MDPSVLAALGLDPNDPQVQMLYGQALQQPEPQPAPVAQEAPADSINDGINSVGRPSDQFGSDAEAQKKLDDDHAKRYKKLLRQGKGEALLALGANLLSARTFGEGLSKGLLAYSQTLKGARDSLKPKREAIGGGAYDRVTDPVTGEATYEETPIAQFEKDKIDLVTGRQKDVQLLRNEGSETVAEINTGSREKIADLQWSTRKDIASLQANAQRYAADVRASAARDVAEINSRAGGKGGPTRATASMLKLATEHQNNLNTTTGAMQNLAPVLQWLETGQLSLNLGKNAMRKMAMATGVGGQDPETQKYAVMRQVIEQNRNAILIAAKGVQTEGDAQRALAQILSSDANTATVKTQFKFLMDILKRSAENERSQLSMIRDNSGLSIPAAEAPAKTSTGVGWKIVN